MRGQGYFVTPATELARLASLLPALFLGGCLGLSGGSSVKAVSEEYGPVYLVGTPRYDAKVATLRLSPTEATALIERELQERHPTTEPVFFGVHQVLIGDEYVFAAPHKLGSDLNGWYVNGRTGTVTRHLDRTFIDYDDYARARRKALKSKP